MNWLTAIKSLFAPPTLQFTEAIRLDGRTEEALFQSLKSLIAEDRGWITFDEARSLFSRASPDYAFGEKDEEGKQNLSAFAARADCQFEFMPYEGRIYFAKRWG